MNKWAIYGGGVNFDNFVPCALLNINILRNTIIKIPPTALPEIAHIVHAWSASDSYEETPAVLVANEVADRFIYSKL